MKKYLFENEVYSLGELQKKNISIENTVELEVIVPTFDNKKQKLDINSSVIDADAKTYTFGLKDISFWAIFDADNNFIETTEFEPNNRYSDNYKFVEFKNKHLLKIIDRDWAIDSGELKRVNTSKISKKISSYLKREVSRIFVEKTLGIKKIAINKPSVTITDYNSFEEYKEYVNEQYASYKEMYNSAKLSTEPTELEETIIIKHEDAIKRVSSLVLISNNLRAILFGKIDAGLEIFEDVDIVDNFKVNDNDDFDEKLNELMAYFDKGD